MYPTINHVLPNKTATVMNLHPCLVESRILEDELIRDDTSPAQWTDEGKAIIEREGYVCIVRWNPQHNRKKWRFKQVDDLGQGDHEAFGQEDRHHPEIDKKANGGHMGQTT